MGLVQTPATRRNDERDDRERVGATLSHVGVDHQVTSWQP
jgi:hypothetical protein